MSILMEVTSLQWRRKRTPPGSACMNSITIPDASKAGKTISGRVMAVRADTQFFMVESFMKSTPSVPTDSAKQLGTGTFTVGNIQALNNILWEITIQRNVLKKNGGR